MNLDMSNNMDASQLGWVKEASKKKKEYTLCDYMHIKFYKMETNL